MMSLKVRFLFQKLNYIDKEEKHPEFPNSGNSGE